MRMTTDRRRSAISVWGILAIVAVMTVSTGAWSRQPAAAQTGSTPPAAAAAAVNTPLSHAALAATTGDGFWGTIASMVGCGALGLAVSTVATPWGGVPVSVACRLATSATPAY